MKETEFKPTDWKNYRQLEKGETIEPEDEVLIDGKGWRKTICAGGEAPDPRFIAHRMYRRKLLVSMSPDAIEKNIINFLNWYDDLNCLKIDVTANENLAKKYVQTLNLLYESNNK